MKVQSVVLMLRCMEDERVYRALVRLLRFEKRTLRKKSKSALRADLRVSTITIAYLVVRSPPRR